MNADLAIATLSLVVALCTSAYVAYDTRATRRARRQAAAVHIQRREEIAEQLDALFPRGGVNG